MTPPGPGRPTITRRRRDVIGIIGSLVVIAITVGLIVAVNAGRPGPGATPVDPVEVVASDATILLQFRDDRGEAVGDLVIAGGDAVSILSLPPTLLVPTPSPMPLARTPLARDTLAARNGVSALLGIRLDAVVSIDRLALAGLVDAVGGAPLDIPRRLVERDDAGRPTLAIFPGARVLPGTSAAAYAMVRQGGEPEDARMERLAAVLGQVLTALPRGADDLRALVVSLGASARSTVGADDTAGILARIRDGVDGGITLRSLPVTPLVGDVSSSPRQPEATAVVRSAFPHALLAAGESPLPRITLRRAGAGAAPLVAAQARLADAGMAVVGLQRAPAPAAASVVIVPNRSAAAIARGIEIASVLGLPATAVQPSEDSPPLPQSDALVVLGTDAVAHGIG